MNTLAVWSPRILSLLRVITALLFMEHGMMKLFGFPAPQPGVEGSLPPMLLIAALIELVGGALIAVGLFTRVAAFVASGMIAVGYFIAHAPRSFFPALNDGEPAVLFSFIFFYLVFAGPGSLSVDAVRAGGKAPH